MVNWISSRKFHFVFWAALIVFVFSGNSLYTHFILKNGVPYQPGQALPAESKDIFYKFGNFATIRVDGQDLYELRGFAFKTSDPLAKNKISIVLRSASDTLVIATRPITVPGMIRSYTGYKTGMDVAEFSLFLSQTVFKPGVYQLGVLLEDQAGTNRTFLMTNSSIQITPNTLKYTP